MAILPHSAAHRRRGLHLAFVLLLCLLLAVKHSVGAPQELRLPSPAYQAGGTTMVPIHPIVAWLGGEIRLTQGAATITLTREGHSRKVELRPGSASIFIDGRPARLSRPASFGTRRDLYASGDPSPGVQCHKCADPWPAGPSPARWGAGGRRPRDAAPLPHRRG
ncbi:MAG: hypothetical protein GX785_04720 [Armatimonadetes bacterium]|nr:hypothetical protein [Armatimonadota bacterium]